MSKRNRVQQSPERFDEPKTYTTDELEDLAFQSAPLPEYLNMADTLLFLSFRSLYDFAKRVEMSPEQGRREKQKLLQAHEQYLFRDRLLDRSVQLWRELEQHANAYRTHDRTDFAGLVGIADAILKTIYRVEAKNNEKDL